VVVGGLLIGPLLLLVVVPALCVLFLPTYESRPANELGGGTSGVGGLAS